MTLKTLRNYYKEANKWKNTDRFPAMVIELCNEVFRLRMIADERNGEFSEYTLMPFGQHKGKKLLDVPEDYLRWWHSKQDRGIIILEYHHGPYAQRNVASMKLRLYDYLNTRFKEQHGNQVQDD
jgi:hypothetical protein